MQDTEKQVTQPSLTLKEWIYTADGTHIKELVKASFLEFYFAKQTKTHI